MEARWLPASILPVLAVASDQPAALVATTTIVTSSANPVGYDKSVELTATVTAAPGGGMPTGTVTFQDGSTVLGSSPLVVGTQAGTGVATMAVSPLLSLPNGVDPPPWSTAGPQPITATYSGDANDQGSTSAVFTQVVEKIGDTLAVGVTNPLIVGQPVTLFAGVQTLLIADPFRSHVTGIGGTVTFYDGSTTLGTIPVVSGPTGRLELVYGSASLTLPSLALGPHAFRATYSGDPDFSPNAATAPDQDLEPAPTTTSIVVAPEFPTTGQKVALSATVAGPNPGSPAAPYPAPTGTVTFYDFGTALGTVAVNAAPGTSQDTAAAAFTIPELGPGAHAFRAVYGGDAAYQGSGSSGPVPTTTTLATTANPIDPNPNGAQATITATVAAPAGQAAPAGSLAFYDGLTLLEVVGLKPGPGSTSTASIILPSPFQEFPAGPGLPGAGTPEITAVYTGENQPDRPSISKTLVETFAEVRPVISLGVPVHPTGAGASVAVTVGIIPSFNSAGVTGPAPTGSVVIYKDGRRLGTARLVAEPQPGLEGAAAEATFSIPAVGLGLHNITVYYAGDSIYAAKGTAANFYVNAQTLTTIAATPAAPVVGRPIVVTATVVAPDGGGVPTGTVAFAVGGHPLGTARLDAKGRAVFAFQPAASGPAVITATYQGQSHKFYAGASAPLRVTVGVPA